MIITLTNKQVKALLACAAKNDVRYYLNSILIDNSGDNGCIVVATDGPVLLAGNPLNLEYPEHGKWIVPRDILELALKTKAKDFFIEVGTSPSGSINNLPFTCIDGVFPPWRQVLSDATEHVPSDTEYQFDPDLMSVAHTAAIQFSDMNKAQRFLARVSKDGSQLYYHAPSCFTLVAGLNAKKLADWARIPV